MKQTTKTCIIIVSLMFTIDLIPLYMIWRKIESTKIIVIQLILLTIILLIFMFFWLYIQDVNGKFDNARNPTNKNKAK